MPKTKAAGTDSLWKALVLLLATLGSSQVDAQAPTAAPQSAPESSELDTIVVTAERRTERLQDVPISITNIGANQLEDINAQNLGDIVSLTPGLRFDYGGTIVQPTIRGVGTALALSGGGSNVGIYVDGFYSPNPNNNDFQLMNIDSIQVLKGPQGTLFGRNTTGGAILVNTTKPSADSNAVVTVDYGRFNTQKYEAYATTGLTQDLAWDVSAVLGKSDGFITNIANGDNEAGRYDNWSIRTGLKFDPAQGIEFLFRYTHQNTDDRTNLAANAYFADGVSQVYGRFIPGTIYTSNPNEVAYDDEPVAFFQRADAYQLTSTFDLDFATLTSYSQYQRQAGNTYNTLDDESTHLLNIDLIINDRTVTQEFLLASKPGGALQWTTGIFYADIKDIWPVDESLFGSPLAFGVGSGTDTRSGAVYGDATYQVVDRWFLTGGLRFTHDEVSDAFFETTTRTDLPTLTTNRFTPRVVLRYAIDPESSTYFSFSRGYKAAIYNVGGQQTTPIAPEALSAFEVGYKYAARALTADAAAYLYDYKDLQVESYTTVNGIPGSVIENAATARIYGLDGDVSYEVLQGLQLRLGVNYTHARYTTFTNSPSFTECLQPSCGASFGIYENTVTDASGFEMLRAPPFTASAGVIYKRNLAGGELALSSNYYYSSKFYFDSSNQFQQDHYSTTDVRAAWTDPSNRFTVAVYGNNIFDARYLTQVLGNVFGAGAVWNYPTTYGASITLRFH